ncbi:hypothetical protein [Raoultella sp. BIGb0399]
MIVFTGLSLFSGEQRQA